MATLSVCTSNKIDSNVTGLYFAEEECLKLLPDGTVAGDELGAVWRGLEPNSYNDFGGNFTTTARAPIDPSRQNKKGVITDLSAAGGFQMDLTKSNTQRLMQGFMFADAREKPTTRSIRAYDNTLDYPFTSVTASSKTYAAATGLLPFNNVRFLVLASGFTNGANNGLKHVASATAGTIVVTENLADEPAPPSLAKLEVCGLQFAAGDASLTVDASGLAKLNSTVGGLDQLGFVVGEWLYIGGDLTANAFVKASGYVRIKSIASNSLLFDDTSFFPIADTGTGKSVQIFFGTVIKNENTPALIKRRSYQLERQLGMGANDVQAEYLVGAVANEFKLTIPTSEKLTVDMSFVAADHITRSGDVGDQIKPGIRLAARGEDAINSTSNVARIKMAILDPTTSDPSALFAFVTDGSITINNGVKPTKAVGVLGSMDTSAGNFVVSGSVTAYFSTIAGIRAVRNNADVSLNIIVAAKNAGVVYDIPLVGLGGGRATVTKDDPIKLPLEASGAQNAAGYTMLFNSFPYLPTVAQPN